MIEKLEAMLGSGQDSALLRFSLGTAYLKQQNIEQATLHLEQAVRQDPEYSAAWKAYGKALAGLGRMDAARQAYQAGIAVAEKNGDIQAVKEMRVFLKRIQKTE